MFKLEQTNAYLNSRTMIVLRYCDTNNRLFRPTVNAFSNLAIFLIDSDNCLWRVYSYIVSADHVMLLTSNKPIRSYSIYSLGFCVDLMTRLSSMCCLVHHCKYSTGPL